MAHLAHMVEPALPALSLDHDFHEEVEAGEDCCQSHYHLLLGVILAYQTSYSP